MKQFKPKVKIKPFTLALISCLCALLFAGLVFYCRHTNLALRRESLERQFFHAIQAGDLEGADKVLKKLEEWEEEFNQKAEKRYREVASVSNSNHGIPGSDSYPLTQFRGGFVYRALLCEAAQNWDEAFRYLDECDKFENDPTIKCEWFGLLALSTGHFRARLHYEMGDKAQAFKELCEISSKIVSYLDTRSLAQEKRDRKRLGRYGAIFPNYGEFLAFMEEEFAKLGSPLEYQDEMTTYREIETTR